MPIDDKPKRYVFLLLPGFSPLGFTCAQEALALANRFADGRQYYDWMLLSEDGGPVTAWNGLQVSAQAGLIDLDRHDTLVVCAGVDAAAGSTRKVMGWLRRETRRGIDFGAISSGSYTLALAGLLSGRTVTTHWEYATAMAEKFPDVTVRDAIYSVDGRVFSCAGSASSMDLMLERIRLDYGGELSGWVADQMVYPARRPEGQGQRGALWGQLGVRHSSLARAIDIMRANLEEPLAPSDLARAAGVSIRQLERLFARYLETSPKRYYLGLRLEKARSLLAQTDLPLMEISLVCGFKAPSHFSKTYRKAFGVPPSRDTGSASFLVSRR
ncbi:GlxA family transcriptional regulator [Roseovarius aestuarii]|nr:GlxA family transcriptional regulator [Roseovarius aestuarii]